MQSVKSILNFNLCIWIVDGALNLPYVRVSYFTHFYRHSRNIEAEHWHSVFVIQLVKFIFDLVPTQICFVKIYQLSI